MDVKGIVEQYHVGDFTRARYRELLRLAARSYTFRPYTGFSGWQEAEMPPRARVFRGVQGLVTRATARPAAGTRFGRLDGPGGA